MQGDIERPRMYESNACKLNNPDKKDSIWKPNKKKLMIYTSKWNYIPTKLNFSEIINLQIYSIYDQIRNQ